MKLAFIPQKYLLRQHRFLDLRHPYHMEKYRMDIKNRKQMFYFSRSIFFDMYFMNWFCGFCDAYCLFQLNIENNKKNCSFITYHQQYKLLRWVRYNFNFGLVDFAKKYNRYFYFVKRKKHLLILIEVFNGFLQMSRTQRQFYIWLKSFNQNSKIKVAHKMQTSLITNLFDNSYLMGLIDTTGRLTFAVGSYKKYGKHSYDFGYKTRFVFYMDLPATEIILLNELKKLFSSPYFIVRSSKTIRFLLIRACDLGTLGNYLMRKKPFNRLFKIKFFNWFAALQYLRLKDIKYPRRDRFRELIGRYRSNYYNPRKKKRGKLIWPTDLPYIDLLPPRWKE
jgi:hypothetical protein